MKCIKKLEIEVVTTLKELIKNHSNHRARVRAHAILLSHSGYTMQEISNILFVSRVETISQWIDRWASAGLIGLFDNYRSGRPEILSIEEKAEAVNIVKSAPRNLKLALVELCEKIQKTLSIDTLKRTLKANNLRWKRARKSLKNRRDEEEFYQAKAEIELLKERHRSNEIDLRFFDESGYDLTPSVPYAWQEKGKSIELPASRSKRANVLGFLNLDSQLESYVFNDSISSDIVVACFDDFAGKIIKPTYVILDNASIHKSDEFEEKIEEWKSKNLFVKFLPAYSPELNLIEILWRFIKYHWLSLEAYKNVKSLNDNLDEVLRNIGTKYRITFA